MSVRINCLIVDDEPLARDVIKGHIDNIPQLNLIGDCPNAIEALEYLNHQNLDLLFLDIEMPELSGLDFLRSLSRKPDVILTTAYRDYALESYEIDVIDYLLKPISFNRFFKAIDRYFTLRSPNQASANHGQSIPVRGGSIFVYSDKKNIKVYFDDILYIESIKDYVRVHTQDRNIISKDTITRYQELLPGGFLRIHRSFIVNTDKITAFTQHDVELGGKELPIGISYKRRVIEKLKKSG